MADVADKKGATPKKSPKLNKDDEKVKDEIKEKKPESDVEEDDKPTSENEQGHEDKEGKEKSETDVKNDDAGKHDVDIKRGEGKKVIAKRISGTVKWFNLQKGYGFIVRDDGEPDIFVHHTAIDKKNPKSPFRTLRNEEKVEFDVVVKMEAVNISGPDGQPVRGAFVPRIVGGYPRGGPGPRPLMQGPPRPTMARGTPDSGIVEVRNVVDGGMDRPPMNRQYQRRPAVMNGARSMGGPPRPPRAYNQRPPRSRGPRGPRGNLDQARRRESSVHSKAENEKSAGAEKTVTPVKETADKPKETTDKPKETIQSLPIDAK